VKKKPPSMAMYEVTWVDREDDISHESIVQLGGAAWRANAAAVITDIESGRNTYYVRRFGRNCLIAVVAGPSGKYLRARTDASWTDFLLEMPAEKPEKSAKKKAPPSATSS
jgi:hypothetical protein